MKKGWIKISRKIQEHWLWDEKPFSKGQAWIDLLMLANHETKKMAHKGEIITCERGTVNLSISFLAERWGWSRDKTRHFLKLLESDGMVTVNATTHRTTITIEKYALYNDSPTTKRQQTDSKSAADRQPADTTKNDKNDKNINNKYIYYGEFENVVLSDEEIEKLKTRFSDWEERIEKLSAYMKSTGKKYQSHYATILAWDRRDKKKEKEGANGNEGNKESDSGEEPKRKLGTYI